MASCGSCYGHGHRVHRSAITSASEDHPRDQQEGAKRETMRRAFLLAPVVGLLAASAGFATPALAASSTGAKGDPDVLYKSTVTPLPGNLPSIGFQADQASEFGNQIRMTKTANTVSKVTVTMSSFACQSGTWNGPTPCGTTPGAKFTEPITLNLYNAPTTGTFVPGSLIVSVTKTFAIPYRPSANATSCPSTPFQWFDGSLCNNGKANNIVFSLASLHITLPQDIVFGIAYNTSQFGYHPFGALPCESTVQGCPYDSLNIALSQDPTNVTKGHDPDFGKLWWNTATASNYCDGGANGVNSFRLDSPSTTPCWGVNPPGDSAPFYVPAAQFMES
jgi:hypothetical protein